jgi:universal stress protein A
MYRIRTILVPTDFSEWSRSAFGLACDLARVHQARVIVLHVYPPPIAYGEVLARREPDGYEEVLDYEMRSVHPAIPEVPVTYRLAEGDPLAAIRSTAAEERCDLIVMGTHGRTGVRRLLMGSVAEHVLRQAPCPVLTVNRPLPAPAESAAKEVSVT